MTQRLEEWFYEVSFKLDASQSKQYNKLCKEVEVFVRGINKRLAAERAAKKTVDKIAKKV